ncbi:c-type cytochrome [Solimonas soli]|uniref:c-type cytochrome n=1 Tax=Solimonas soli TaxID=413479 RepID=UPI0004B54D22|nr:cytochrome c [Solimonas soli]
MKFPHLSSAAVAMALLFVAACERKPPLAPEIKQAMEARHEGFETIGDSMKKIGDTLKGGGQLDPELAAAAKKINELAPQTKTWFPAGSGPETGRKTGAKAEIWAQPEVFAEKRDAFIAAAARLAQLADANDAAGFATQAGELGQACKGCHDQFREKKH